MEGVGHQRRRSAEKAQKGHSVSRRSDAGAESVVERQAVRREAVAEMIAGKTITDSGHQFKVVGSRDHQTAVAGGGVPAIGQVTEHGHAGTDPVGRIGPTEQLIEQAQQHVAFLSLMKD